MDAPRCRICGARHWLSEPCRFASAEPVAADAAVPVTGPPRVRRKAKRGTFTKKNICASGGADSGRKLSERVAHVTQARSVSVHSILCCGVGLWVLTTSRVGMALWLGGRHWWGAGVRLGHLYGFRGVAVCSLGRARVQGGKCSKPVYSLGHSPAACHGFMASGVMEYGRSP